MWSRGGTSGCRETLVAQEVRQWTVSHPLRLLGGRGGNVGAEVLRCASQALLMYSRCLRAIGRSMSV